MKTSKRYRPLDLILVGWGIVIYSGLLFFVMAVNLREIGAVPALDSFSAPLVSSGLGHILPEEQAQAAAQPLSGILALIAGVALLRTTKPAWWLLMVFALLFLGLPFVMMFFGMRMIVLGKRSA